MLIECIQCQKHYNIDDAKITDEGFMFTCLQCGASFLVRSCDEPSPTAGSQDWGPDRTLYVWNEGAALPLAAYQDAAFIDEEEVSLPYAQAMGAITISREATLAVPTGGPPVSPHSNVLDQSSEPYRQRVGIEKEKPQPVADRKGKQGSRQLLLRRFLGIFVLCSIIVSAAVTFMIAYPILRNKIHFKKGAVELVSRVNQLLGFENPENGSIHLSDINGYFVTRDKNTRIFVIEGKATNRFKSPCSFLQVNGTLFDEKGETAAQESSYCGNVLSLKELQTYSPKAISERLSNAYGTTLSNLNLEPDQSLPFMLVFFDPPANVSEYSVQVADFKAAHSKSP